MSSWLGFEGDTGGNCEFCEDGERQREAKGYRERESDKEDVSRRQGDPSMGQRA